MSDSLDPTAVEVSLTFDERMLLRAGLNQLGGPALPTRVLTQLINADSEHFFDECDRLDGKITNEQALTPVEWTRALLLTEVTFASDVIGFGVEWSVFSGLRDHETLDTLRGLQRKLAHVVHATDIIRRPAD